MSRATEELLASLHGALADEMLKRIQSGEATPSDLNAARQFLKDNNINCDGQANPTLKKLSDDLPEDLDDPDNVVPIYGG